MRFAVALICAATIVVGPFMVVTSGGVVNAVTGAGTTPSIGNTVLSEMHLHGLALVTLSRITPIVLAVVLGWWVSQRLGSAALEPVPLVALAATSLTFRLVFEVNLFGYYFMAVAVSLIMLDVIRRRISVYLLAWLALVTLAFDPLPWGNDPLSQAIPVWLWQIVLVPIALALAAGPLFRHASVDAMGNRVKNV
jgi:hypothetical protein